jgi:hypothetical protein
LFACACARRFAPLLSSAQGRQALEIAEQFADWAASCAELDAAHAAAEAMSDPHLRAREIALLLTQSRDLSDDAELALAVTTARRIAGATADTAHPLRERDWEDDWSPAWDAWHAAGKAESKVQAALVRDLFGNPFRPAYLAPGWRKPAVLAIAQGMYGDRCFDDLPILADALEEAGCREAAILSHCREPGLHARGCWVVDAVLGRCESS